MGTTIVHISEVNIHQEGGMARVEYYWQEAFERIGVSFTHIGPKETGNVKHPSFFPSKAYEYYKKSKLSASAVIAHEPAVSKFISRQMVSFAESHGVERRYWELQVKNDSFSKEKLSCKTRLLYPLWRLRGCDKGLQHASKLLLINSEDADYVKNKYKRSETDMFIFKNGVHLVNKSEPADTNRFTILFNGSWIERKGIHVLTAAAEQLYSEGFDVGYLLTGTGKNAREVLNDWPDFLHSFITIVPHFSGKEEIDLLQKSSLFVLPSYFEGQPLSLLQAMAAGKCCITTNCCGQKDIIQNGTDGFLFEPGNSRQLADYIRLCIQEPDVRKRIENNAYSILQSRTWATVSDEVVQFVMSNL